MIEYDIKNRRFIDTNGKNQVINKADLRYMKCNAEFGSYIEQVK